MKKKEFVNLHCHTSLGSMLDSLNDTDAVFDMVAAFGQRALAITDHGTLAAHFDAFNAYKRTGVKFIPGLEAYFVNSLDPLPKEDGKGRTKYEKRKHLLLLAQNHTGYKNLLNLNFLGFKNHNMTMGRVFPRIDWDMLEKHSEGIICTSACGSSPVSRKIMEGDFEGALEVAQRFAYIFKDRFFIELHPHHLKVDRLDQQLINRKLITIARLLKLPVTTAADTHYLTRKMEKYHDVLLAINSKKPVDDPDRHRYGIDEFYVKQGFEIHDFLSKHYGERIADQALMNTIRIAEMCDKPDYMEITGNHLPIFPVKEEKDYKDFVEWSDKQKSSLPEDTAFMRFRCLKGFKEKFKNLSREERDIRWNRVKKELRVLEGNNFSSYMLVVADYIQWAKDNDILTSVGRGSIGGSLVAYLLGIHGVDPLKYGLLFERFQNAYKTDLPDIDTDFTSAGRDKVKEYVKEKYGREYCAQVSNINTYTPKNVIPDLVKSMRNVIPGILKPGENYVTVSNAIKAAIPDDAKTLKEAMVSSPKLREFALKCPELMEYADVIVGMPKEYSTHAAGMVISDVPIVEFAPLRVDKHGEVAVQYEKNRCEAIGLVKMDFLAISTLDVIEETFKNIAHLGIDGPKKTENIPLDDEKTYEMIQNGETRCVFQLGKSGTMLNLCRRIKPKNIVDIAVINALGRPSSAKERQEYIDRRFGSKEITYLHPSLSNALNQTYGICLFEEQLMSVAENVAGWDLNKADGLRKLTKLKAKGKDLALKLEADFVADTIKHHNISFDLAQKIWDKIVAPYAGYGFNKSHAVFYSINGYITAYLKCHYPAAFLTAFLKIKTLRGGIHKDAEIAMAKGECKRLGVNIMPPDINRSSASYEVLDEKTIVMGFAAIKGLGEKAISEIVGNQPYHSFKNFIATTPGRVVNKSKIEALAKAGCFDSLKISRKTAHNEGKNTRDKLNAFIRRKLKDGYDQEMAVQDFPVKFSVDEWEHQQILRHEQEVLGELVSGTIDEMFPNFFTNQNVTPISRLKVLPNRAPIVVEVVVKALSREFKIKKGKYKNQIMIKYQVEDVFGNETEMTVWPDKYKEAKERIIIGTPIRARCQISEFNGVKTIMLRDFDKFYQ